MSIPKKLEKNENWNDLLRDNESKIIKSKIYQDKLNIVIDYLKVKSGRILDIGFGYGYLERFLQSNLNLKIFGIDISPDFVRKVTNSVRGSFKVANITNIPFKNEYFDIVVALDVLEHVEVKKIDIAYGEIYRVLKQDGIAIISVPLNESDEDMLKNFHQKKYSYDILRDELERYGFKVLKSYFLTAFCKHYLLKKIVNFLLRIRRPNLVIVLCGK